MTPQITDAALIERLSKENEELKKEIRVLDATFEGLWAFLKDLAAEYDGVTVDAVLWAIEENAKGMAP